MVFAGLFLKEERNINIESIDLSTVKYVSKQDHEEFCKRVRPKMGDILYTKGGTTGIAKVNNIDIDFKYPMIKFIMNIWL